MASGSTPICDASIRKDYTEASGHGPPIVLGTVIGLITGAPDTPIYRDKSSVG
jgi:mannose/fructose/N-acetylgalactosamine-specific phosphotransferase system component IIC